ncbi:MAG: TonB-dependent receptor plug domain-containing protein [Kiritimatiellia bacterium]
MMFETMRRGAVCLGFCLAAWAGVAQTASNVLAATEGTTSNIVVLARVLVTASPITDSERVGKDGANSVVVSRQQIKRLSATDLPTALRQVPGVSISRYSPVGAYGGGQGGSVYIRGAGTARPGGEIKIYTDGVPRESGVWSHPLMDIAPIDFAERVTVAKNPQPQNYPGTFGAVNIETKRRHTQGHEGELDLAYGRFNTLISSASVGGKEDIFDYYAGAAYKYSEGARKHGEAELKSVFARAGWEVTPEEHLAYIFQHTDNWVRDPGPKGAPTPLRDQFDTKTGTHIIRLESERENLKGYSLFYYEDGEISWHKDHLNDDIKSSPPGYSNTDWDNYGFRSSYDLLIERLTLTGSLDSWSEGGKTANILESTNRRVWGYNGRFFTTAPYAGARYDFDLGHDWTLTPSVGSRYYFSSEFDDETAPCAALTLERGGLQLFVSHARGMHYPGIYIRGTSPATWQSLEAETLDTTEAGAHLEVGELAAVHATVFHTEVENRMDATSAGYLNTGSMRANGAELSLHLYPHEDLTLFAGGTYTHPDTELVSRLPDLTSTVGASYQLARYVRWDLDAEYVASQYAHSMRSANPDLHRLESYFVFNTRLAFDLQALSQLNGELYIAAENFTNQHYEYFPGYPMPGVMWYTGMKLKF